ncbi:MAG: TssQ family T6SS-associated lipoprotein [Sideroxydans sp.]
MLRWMAAALCALMIGGCGTVGTCEDGSGGIRLFGDSVARRFLTKGISEYEQGNYVNAQIAFEGVLGNQYATRYERMLANKYMAFMHCISGEQKLCLEHFIEVLTLNPDFELTDAEAGHPLWGPVFKNAKASTLGK